MESCAKRDEIVSGRSKRRWRIFFIVYCLCFINPKTVLELLFILP
jgi:hypothetical protein